MQRPMLVDQREHAVHKLLTLEVAHLAERDLAAEMVVAVRVASGQRSGHSRVISIDIAGVYPVRMRPHAEMMHSIRSTL